MAVPRTLLLTRPRAQSEAFAEVLAAELPGRFRAVVSPILEVRTDDAPGATEALLGAAGVIDAAMFGRALHVTVQDAEEGRAVVERALAAVGRPVTGIRAVEPSLEDVFVSLVRAEGGAVVG